MSVQIVKLGAPDRRLGIQVLLCRATGSERGTTRTRREGREEPSGNGDAGTQVSAGVVNACMFAGGGQPPTIAEPTKGSTANAMKSNVR
jgi:hypothetical protein